MFERDAAGLACAPETRPECLLFGHANRTWAAISAPIDRLTSGST
jgi:hypothetical protein